MGTVTLGKERNLISLLTIQFIKVSTALASLPITNRQGKHKAK